ncbi:hypothetical protein [Alloalcanivorax mobilis]|uniref:hypothetical protein n=1 Tax=Alloalcanivorax mobilis TaxID=2019569 RepID=UPI000C767273|nr:hypothetical protein [Alloalcanivorax mobilis]
MSIWSQIGDTFGDAWETVNTGAQQYVKNEVGDWVSEQQGRPETVNQEASPAPYAGDAAVAQQQADAIRATLQQWKTPAMLVLGGLAVYLIASRI